MRRRPQAALLAGALCLLLAFAAPAASAAYEEVGSFAGNGSGPGGSGSEPGQLSNPGQADVNDATGNLYVADTANNRVEVFKPTTAGGEYDSEIAITAPTGLAIDQSNGDLYVATATGISKFDSSGAPIAVGWTDPAVSGALAVEPSTGDLLVADQSANLIRRFESDGTAAGSFAAERPLDVAVNSSGQVFVVTSTGDLLGCATSAVQRFSAAGTAEATIGSSLVAPSSVAIDGDDDAIVVAAQTNGYNCGGPDPEVAAFDSAGNFVEAITLASTQYATIPGLSVQGAGSVRVYAVAKSPANDFFGPTRVVVLEDPVPLEPAVIAQSAVPTQSEAELRATVDRGFLAVQYHFEYGTTASYGQSTPAANLPAGGGTPTVAASVAGLQPQTTYHFQVVVTNSLGTAKGPDQTFTTLALPAGPDTCPNAASRAAQSSTFLGQCRAYEMVSPLKKNGNDLFLERAQASISGDGLAFTAGGAFGDAESSSLESTYAAFRGADGWRTEGVAPPMQNNILLVEGAKQFSKDLRVSAGTARTVSEPGTISMLRRDSATKAFQLLSPRPNGNQGNIFDGYGSEDLTTYVFPSEEPLIEGDPPPAFSENIYEGSIENGVSSLRLVKSSANLGAGRVENMNTSVSADGSRIFYAYPGTNASALPAGQLYMQENGVETEVSESELSTPEPEHSPAYFFQATADGSKVLFGDPERLTEDSDADGGGTLTVNDLGDLYLYDVEADQLTDLSATAPSGGQVIAILGASDDFETVYFVDRAVLASGASGGAANVYVWSEATGTDFIATLDPADGTTWDRRWLHRTASVSADGSAAVFQSRAALGGYDPNGFIAVYRYDDDDGSIACVSCDTAGEANEDARMIDATTQGTGNMPAHQSRYVTDDGERVFFTTAGKLAARDTNGLADVYTWAGGEVSLISNGQGDAGSFFLDASPDGSDVFFATRQQLVARDTDSLVDAYDARVQGGLPEPPAPSIPCADEACKAPPLGPPAGGVPNTTTQLGAPPRCAGPARKANRLSGKARQARQRLARATGRQRQRARKDAKQAQAKAKAANKQLDNCKRGQS